MVLLQYSNYKRGSVLRTLVPLEGMNNINNPIWVKFEMDCFRQDFTIFIQKKSALVFLLLLKSLR